VNFKLKRNNELELNHQVLFFKLIIFEVTKNEILNFKSYM